MSASSLARVLSYQMRAILVAHVPEPQPIDYTIGTGENNARRTTASLVNRDLLRPDGGDIRRPRFTVLTDFGREVVAHILGNAADFLVSSGALDRSVIAEARRNAAAKTVDAPIDSDNNPAFALVR